MPGRIEYGEKCTSSSIVEIAGAQQYNMIRQPNDVGDIYKQSTLMWWRGCGLNGRTSFDGVNLSADEKPHSEDFMDTKISVVM